MDNSSTEMDNLPSSEEGSGYHEDDSAMSKKAQSCPGPLSSSQDALSLVLSGDGIAQHNVERPGGSEVRVSAEPLSVSSCQSSRPSSSGHHQHGQLIESGFQTETNAAGVKRKHLHTSGSTVTKRCISSKVKLTPEQLRNNTKIHQFFPALPCKTKISVNQNIQEAVSHSGTSKSPMSQGTSGSSAIPRTNAFGNIDPEMLSASSQSIPSLPSSQMDDNPTNTFGLLGEGFSDDETVASGFARLPIEVLQRIFCFVPLMDLCQHLSCVCKPWNKIISNVEFLPWKKLYHRVRQKVKIDQSDQVSLLTKQDEAPGADVKCMLDLVRKRGDVVICTKYTSS